MADDGLGGGLNGTTALPRVQAERPLGDRHGRGRQLSARSQRKQKQAAFALVAPPPEEDLAKPTTGEGETHHLDVTV